MPYGIVTGCAGFIGSHLVDDLLRKNWEILGLDNFHPYYSRKLKELNLKNAKGSKNFRFIEGSILSKEDLAGIVTTLKVREFPDYVVGETKLEKIFGFADI
ncbi:MAG: GDP-mannose 4,6-dehydratase, partial [Thaumarchaeota archaeon]|nr:GDP-mannose 4,6-dehydratase [Nitrososphaerota archaeon]